MKGALVARRRRWLAGKLCANAGRGPRPVCDLKAARALVHTAELIPRWELSLRARAPHRGKGLTRRSEPFQSVGLREDTGRRN